MAEGLNLNPYSVGAPSQKKNAMHTISHVSVLLFRNSPTSPLKIPSAPLILMFYYCSISMGRGSKGGKEEGRKKKLR